MIDVVFFINGNDFSSYLSTYKVRHSVEYQKILTALDGTEHGAARYRPIIEFSLIPLTDEQSDWLYEQLAGGNVTVRYTNPYYNETLVSTMRVTSDLGSAFGLRSIDGNRYYKGESITLRQRTVL